MFRLCRAVFSTALLLLLTVGLVGKAQLRVVEAHVALSEFSSESQSGQHDHDDHAERDVDFAAGEHGHSHPEGFPQHSHDGHTHVALQFQMADVVSKSESANQTSVEALVSYSLPANTRVAGDSYVIELIRPPIA